MDKKYLPQEKWAIKNGYIAKTYKLPVEIVEKFKETCAKEGVSQSSALVNLISKFIEKHQKKSSSKN